MPNPIDVSVIIPSWNAADTIGALLQQLLSEHNVSMEIIVVDDGSTDDTRHIVASIEDPRLVLVTQSIMCHRYRYRYRYRLFQDEMCCKRK